MSDSIVFENDLDPLDDERTVVRLRGREWLLEYDRGDVEWLRKYNDWLANEGKIIQEQGENANLDHLYELAGTVLDGANPAWHTWGVRPRALTEVLRFFKLGWYGGSRAIRQEAEALNATRPQPEMAAPTQTRSLVSRRRHVA